MTTPHVLIISPDASLNADLQQRLRNAFEFCMTGTAQEASEWLKRNAPQAVVADFRANCAGGHSEAMLLESLHATYADVKAVLVTGVSCPEPLERVAACTNLTHLRDGNLADQIATLLKGSLSSDIESTVESAAPVEPVAAAEPVESDEPADMRAGIAKRFLTKTPKLLRMLADLEIAAKHDVTMLLIGETGSGKTYLSRMIHDISPRNHEPFLVVACGALPSDLIESELFGHVKGAFTSAHADKEGKFLAAKRGTILLDEIDVLGPDQQVKLLRVIETGEFEPVGSNRTYKSQARLVVASNLELQPLVEQGQFRPDLYYRLNMLKFEIPPLRERKPDVIPLAQQFVVRLAERHKVAIFRIDDDFLSALCNYPWPGNVRELENVVQRAVIFSRNGMLTAEQLPPHIVMGMAGPVNDPTVMLSSLGESQSGNLGRQIAVTERELIEQSLFNNNFSRTKTAKELGISRVTLYNKMKKYGVNV